MMQSETRKLWLARLLIGLVLCWNLECALAFLWRPGDYAPGFELAGGPGVAMVRGLGILFLMWNVPYALAAWHPRRQRTSLLEALAMQAIGLLGETALFFSLPAGHAALRGTAMRFILFDGAGLVLLCGAALLGRGRP
jgi:hypothetical protein